MNQEIYSRGYSMKHFRLEEWVDFARNVVQEDRLTAMQQHLEAGCDDCHTTLQMWKRVNEFGRRESLYQPSDTAIRSVKGLFGIYGPQKAEQRTGLVKLLFDSLENALPVGVRSTGAAARQLLYSAGAYEVDIRIEPQHETGKVVLTGQLLPSEGTGHAVREIPVSLIRNQKAVSKAITNAFGEFRIRADQHQNLQLRFEPWKGDSFDILVAEPKSPK
jgi:hypothetical protein